MEKSEKILEVSDLSVTFDGFTVLDNLSFSVLKGDALAVIGTNGAGKSVLFRSLMGLVPYKGKISWASDVKIGYVPQKLDVDRMLPLTTEEFLGYKAAGKNEVLEALKMVGIKTGEDNEHHLENHILK